MEHDRIINGQCESESGLGFYEGLFEIRNQFRKLLEKGKTVPKASIESKLNLFL